MSLSSQDLTASDLFVTGIADFAVTPNKTAWLTIGEIIMVKIRTTFHANMIYLFFTNLLYIHCWD